MDKVESAREHVRKQNFNLTEHEIDVAAVRVLQTSEDSVVVKWMLDVIVRNLVMELRVHGFQFKQFDLVNARICSHKLLFSVRPERWQELLQKEYGGPLKFCVAYNYVLTFE